MRYRLCCEEQGIPLDSAHVDVGGKIFTTFFQSISAGGKLIVSGVRGAFSSSV